MYIWMSLGSGWLDWFVIFTACTINHAQSPYSVAPQTPDGAVDHCQTARDSRCKQSLCLIVSTMWLQDLKPIGFWGIFIWVYYSLVCTQWKPTCQHQLSSYRGIQTDTVWRTEKVRDKDNCDKYCMLSVMQGWRTVIEPVLKFNHNL